MKSKGLHHKRQSILFVIYAVVLGSLWLLVYEGYLRPLGQPDQFLTVTTAQAGSTFLNILGFNTHAVPVEDTAMLVLNNEPVLTIARNCNGLIVFVLFAAFIILFPKYFKIKLFFIPLGISVLFLLNILRVVSLTIIYLHHPDWLDFNHTYTFTVIIYAAVFALWMLWVNIVTAPKITSKKVATA